MASKFVQMADIIRALKVPDIRLADLLAESQQVYQDLSRRLREARAQKRADLVMARESLTCSAGANLSGNSREARAAPRGPNGAANPAPVAIDRTSPGHHARRHGWARFEQKRVDVPLYVEVPEMSAPIPRSGTR